MTAGAGGGAAGADGGVDGELALKRTFASRMRAARGKRSLRSVSRASGIAYASVWHYERGVFLPSLPSLVRLADELGVSTDWLLGRK